MPFTEVPQALLFRIELNTNFICAFIANKVNAKLIHYDLPRLTGIIEDRLNMVDLLEDPLLQVHKIIRQELKNYEKEHSRSG